MIRSLGLTQHVGYNQLPDVGSTLEVCVFIIVQSACSLSATHIVNVGFITYNAVKCMDTLCSIIGNVGFITYNAVKCMDTLCSIIGTCRLRLR